MVRPTAPLYLLAGGRSERMGRDKARVSVAGLPLIRQVAVQCGYAVDEVVVVAAPGSGYNDLGFATIHDATAHEGPFSGLLTALSHARSGPVLVAGCDQWGLTSAMLHALLAALGGGAPAAAFRGGFWNPVPLAVEASSRGSVQAAFDAGERSVWRWLERAGAVALPEPEGWSEVVSVDDAARAAAVERRAGWR